MNGIDTDSITDLLLQINWTSSQAKHTDYYQASGVNLWRDLLPEPVLSALKGRTTGDRIALAFEPGELVAPASENNLLTIYKRQFNQRLRADVVVEPRLGRFYPKGIIQGLPNVFSANIEPFRCVGIQNGKLDVDLNHPLADKSLSLSITVGSVQRKLSERGGSSTDWIGFLCQGPGMQSTWRGHRTDYFSDSPFIRQDDAPDSEFYRQPRLVQHIDDTAVDMVSQTYGRFITDRMHVLDLMSSWTTHLPGTLRPAFVSGLGMNEAEMRQNGLLDDHKVYDLNQNPHLPYPSEKFDAVICSVSVEYLINPVQVFKEVARVLKPEGHFIVTFSNRWFPPKVTKIWTELHEFERMGLVLDYFKRCNRFDHLQTWSIRGLPRPSSDKYYPEQRYSDPIYAVWGRRV